MIAWLRTIVLLIPCLAPTHIWAAQWDIVSERSSIAFQVAFEGMPVTGRFQRYNARLSFAPETLAECHFDVRIETASAHTGSRDVDEGLIQSEWFDSAAFPEARFVSTRFHASGGNQYRVEGTLTIKGIRHPVVVPFTWLPIGDGVRVHGETVLNRTDFRIGEKEWADDTAVGFPVTVTLDLVLRERGR